MPSPRPSFPATRVSSATVARQVQLEFRLDPSEIAGLADAQMDQLGQPVFHHHAPRPIFVIPGALLQGPGLLQQGFLRMDQHPLSLPAFGRDALGPQWTGHAFGAVELESPQAVDPSHIPKVPAARSTRPLAWGERANIICIPTSSMAQLNWVAVAVRPSPRCMPEDPVPVGV